jgi:glycosyltransferase involved in cell wall biosynthesis
MNSNHNNTMNILITIAGIAPELGGPSRSVPSLAHHLAMRDDAEVRLMTLCAGDPPVVSNTRNGYATDFFPFGGSFERMRAVYRMRNALASKAVEHSGRSVIHDQGIWLMSNHAAVRVARKTRTPMVVSLRGMLEPWAINHNGFKKKIAWSLYQKRDLDAVDLIHATSRQEADNFMELGLRKPVAVIPNGVDLPPLRKRTRFAGDVRTILFLSRIHPKKGLLNLVSAWQQVRRDGWRIIVAGPDENGHQREVMAAVCAAGLQDSIEFIGPVGDEAKWESYSKADLFVLPTFSENFGIVVAEALACGVPVITTTGTPWQELVAHECGWWVEIGAEPLAEALQSAMALSDEERHNMGERGRQLVTVSYSWGKIAEDMVKAYAWILGESTRPDFVVVG